MAADRWPVNFPTGPTEVRNDSIHSEAVNSASPRMMSDSRITSNLADGSRVTCAVRHGQTAGVRYIAAVNLLLPASSSGVYVIHLENIFVMEYKSV